MSSAMLLCIELNDSWVTGLFTLAGASLGGYIGYLRAIEITRRNDKILWRKEMEVRFATILFKWKDLRDENVANNVRADLYNIIMKLDTVEEEKKLKHLCETINKLIENNQLENIDKIKDSTLTQVQIVLNSKKRKI